MKRRDFIGYMFSVTASAVLTPRGAVAAPSEAFEIEKSEEEWRKILTPEQFAILREQSTERAFSSVLNDEKRDGTFHCAGCDLPLYSSKAKYDSGTGWPSFYEALPDAIGTSTDFKLIYPRTEVHCRRCGGHLGHVFNDGPKPTGKRHCINGAAMTFKPANQS
ncbi:peptide-methionine (R)-S-oxide reductase MsrB [uncultured Cohaesibacter sp.]|uniref:peptide-methionine (R)-S-oxide reductase MsrB n=1 Tax=uncultured Cohaesibacter sp. TaxID=1002546 RepID=UPI00292F5811|nr:peptide-methionine (R)-S-oxide reductase MsrB [uncultured Cohaesibacter sp.]